MDTIETSGDILPQATLDTGNVSNDSFDTSLHEDVSFAGGDGIVENDINYIEEDIVENENSTTPDTGGNDNLNDMLIPEDIYTDSNNNAQNDILNDSVVNTDSDSSIFTSGNDVIMPGYEYTKDFGFIPDSARNSIVNNDSNAGAGGDNSINDTLISDDLYANK